MRQGRVPSSAVKESAVPGGPWPMESGEEKNSSSAENMWDGGIRSMERKSPCSLVPALAAVSAVSTTLTLLLNVLKPEWILSSIGHELAPGRPLPSLPATATPAESEETDPLPRLLPFPFRAVGYSAYTLVVTAAYRTGPSSWMVLGLGPNRLFNSKAVNDTRWACFWIDAAGDALSSTSEAVRVDRPGMDFKPGLYVALVIGCSFPGPVGAQGAGGALVLRLSGPRHSYGKQLVGWAGPVKQDHWMPRELRRRVFFKLASGSSDKDLEVTELQLVAATERSDVKQVDPNSEFLYEDLYCGSPIYGNVSVLAMSEWLSYHFYLLGNKSHFVINDAGAVGGNEGMRKALQQWVEVGIVTIHDVRNLQDFEGFYFHQALVINDCLYKYRLLARKIWFFDIDEYILFRPPTTLESVVKKYPDQDVIRFGQVKFSDNLCREGESSNSPATACYGASGLEEDTRWTAERLLFRERQAPPIREKYVVLQPKRVFSTGIHQTLMPKELKSLLLHKHTEAALYHYHNSITKNRSELCGFRGKPKASHMLAQSTPHKDSASDWEFDDAILPGVAAAKHFIRLFFAERNATSLV